MSWAQPYLGSPFRDGGRGPDTFDCWGLVRAVYADCLEIDLPAYGEISADDLRTLSRAMTAAKDEPIWLPVQRPTGFDVVLMRQTSGLRIAHVGIVFDEQSILHTQKATGVANERMDSTMIRHRIVGFRRHRSLC